MSRRTFCVGLAAAAVLPCSGAAPSGPKIRRVGILGVFDIRGDEVWPPLVEELAKRGYVEGRTIAFVSRSCGEQLDRLYPLARELVGLVEVIISTSTDALPALKRATQIIPVVMTASEDPVRDGWVQSLAHPGGNITGNAVSADEIALKQLELLIEVLGAPKRIGYVVFEQFRSRPTEVRQAARLKTAASARGVQLESVGLVDGHAMDEAFRGLARSGFDGVVLQNHATIGLDDHQVAAIVLRHRIPTIMYGGIYARAGVPFTFGPSRTDLYGRAGIYVARILSGAKAADLPVELPTKFEFVVNLKTASALGLTLPQSILLRADEVIR